jgi:hypothetical protein
LADWPEKVQKTPETGPRELLWNRKDFGHIAGAPWKPFAKADRSKVGAAFYQHLVVIRCREQLPVSGFKSVAKFEERLGTKGVVQKKFAGEKRASTGDYLLWAHLLGRRVMVTWRKGDARVMLFPEHLVKSQAPAPRSRRPKAPPSTTS